MTDTIFALATGPGRAAVAVIRLSGSRSHEVVRLLAGRLPPPRRASLAKLRDPDGGELIDEALVIVFAEGSSESGEPGAEFHLHGSPAVVRAILSLLARQPGLREAEPGEFARRAFHAGRVDLAQLEGLADLIDADTDRQRRQAQRQLSGAMRAAVEPWRAALIEAAALAETAIDFSDDVELGDALPAAVAAVIEPVREGLARELALAPAAERLRDGVQVVIAGPPNAGKSTLLNALARREAAIVSAIAGTTRDPIEVHLDFGGCPVTLVDTAGLRDSDEPVEVIGIRRARARIAEADLVLWLSKDGLGEDGLGDGLPAGRVWRLAAKCDLAAAAPANVRPGEALPVSAVTGEGIAALLERLADHVAGYAGEAGLLARERHRLACRAALDALDRAAAAGAPELMAEELRGARHALDRLIGAVDVEDVLGHIFGRFCIGK